MTESTEAAMLLSGDRVARLRVRYEPDLAPESLLASRSLLDGDALTSVHRLNIEEDFFTTMQGTPRLLRDNPYLESWQRDALDDSGMVRVGERVRRGTILASIVRPSPNRGKKRQAGMEAIDDISLQCLDEWVGSHVISARMATRRQLGRSVSSQIAFRVWIDLERVERLNVGDLLEVPGVVRVAVTGMFHDETSADLLVGAAMAGRLALSPRESRLLEVAKLAPLAREQLQYRSTGAYSLITQQPLGGRSATAAARVTESNVAWLMSRGLEATLGELTVLKSDDIGSRGRLRRAICETQGSGNEDIRIGAPNQLAVAISELRGLAIAVQPVSVDSRIVLQLGLMDDGDIRQLSSGRIRKPETLNYRTFAPVPEGIFCEKTFGPDDGPQQEATQSTDTQPPRRTRFGHIELAAPIVPFHLRPVIARALAVTEHELAALLAEKREAFWDGGSLSLTGGTNKTSSGECLGSGAAAVEQALARINPAILPPELRQRPSCAVLRLIPVIPPDLRPIVLLESGNFATSDLNDHYRMVINRTNRLAKLIELDAPEAILSSDRVELQKCVDGLFANTILAKDAARIRTGSDEPLRDLWEMVAWRFDPAEGKRVDWCGTARAICSSSLPSATACVPAAMMDELLLVDDDTVLLTAKEGDGAFVGAAIKRHDAPVLIISSDLWTRLGLAVTENPPLILHRPIRAAAKAEAIRLRTAIEPHCDVAQSPLDPVGAVRDMGTFVTTMVSAAIAGSSIPLRSPGGVMLGGVGVTELTPWERTSEKAPISHVVPKPPPPPPAEAPTWENVAELFANESRTACIFRPSPDVDDRPGVGRLGGRPWLPQGYAWPMCGGHPLDFIAQLPTTPAIECGAIPATFPRDHLLTVFWGLDWSEKGPATSPPFVLIPLSDDLVHTRPPQEAYSGNDVDELPLLLLGNMEQVREFPSETEAAELILLQFDELLPKDRRSLLERYVKTYRTAEQCVKLCGWPAWIQGQDFTEPLVMQIPSIEDYGESLFGDGGTLYIFGTVPGKLDAISQCY